MIFEIFRGRSRLARGKWHRVWFVRLRARNGRILATSEGYTRHPAAWKFVRVVRAGAKDAPVIEVPELKARRRKMPV